jgi:serine/threonine protein phosphatase PrpC
MITISVSSVTGPARNENQDRVWADSDKQVCAVLDGCGASGRIADLLVRAFVACLETSARITTVDQLGIVYNDAGAAVASAVRADVTLRGAGTTLDALVFSEHELLAVHIGDGRIYRIRDGGVEQLSTDHTLVAELVARGELTGFEASRHPHRNVITRAVTGSAGGDPELLVSALHPGDVYVACTDGVWRAVPDAALLEHLTAHPVDKAIDCILSAAEASNDNASIVVAEVR